ncbi:hypothetical protein SEUBUCD646_0D03070 [Saccharomyces eubayanus]|uniref:Survival protein SurE-like phosphatase/nucleotidase domain-containing protein n=1 Tax=Saccharomyces eubayanus TaxID=1080349 RepID=A0ABN8VTL6_SACEU|nr:hypothetical protein SEUBUCD650_0D03060 [Saccharomyces eubayanus]CAI1948550.1 hypothetical protein SEUBUCD646_0D03070 [Saccharomyces eubayanus]
MRVLITNDDGPLSDQFSPYIRPFIQYIKRSYPDWEITICVPHVQKSWVGKAHLAGKNLTAQFIYSKVDAEDNTFWGPFIQPQLKSNHSKLPYVLNAEIPKDAIEWVLIDGTPASCVNIGLHLLSNDQFDLVLSGPNVGRNTSAAYITSSGTVGGAMESVISGNTKAIAISWAYFNGLKDASPVLMQMASKRSLDVIDHLVKNWDPKTDLYSINIPLVETLNDDTKVYYAPIWENRWTPIFNGPHINLENNFAEIEDGNESSSISFHWAPKFGAHNDSIHYKNEYKDRTALTDAEVIESKMISVTPMKATFKGVNHLLGELKLTQKENGSPKINSLAVVSIDPMEYIYKPLTSALKKYLPQLEIVPSLPEFESGKHENQTKIFHYGDYEQLDMDKLMELPKNYYTNSYIYRKALIRKHFLSHTIQTYTAKHPDSILKKAYLESFTIDLDYAEFLDDALDENWELRQELENESKGKWWIVKPSMSDKGQGIRVFKTIQDLQAIFDSFDDEDSEAEESGNDDDANAEFMDNNKVNISQLRHFIIQEYSTSPLLLSSMDNRKFHIRCYVVCKGDLQVFVYDRMLALFAAKPFVPLDPNTYSVTDLKDLECHLTNTCLQSKKKDKDSSVLEFDSLEEIPNEKKLKIKEQIHCITNDVFLAAVNVNRLNFQPLPNAFETYGVDFLVDSDYEVKLLEINAFPDFKQTGKDLKDLIDELFDDTVKYCVAPIFKGNNKIEDEEDPNFVKVIDYTSNDW